MNKRSVGVLRTRSYKAGYEVRTEQHRVGEDEVDLTMKSAYTPDGDYIGSSVWAHRLVAVHGIKPEKANPDDCVCSIGFCEKEQKWYGWSHRAIFGFGVGDTVKEGDCCASSGWVEHPEAEADLSLPVGFQAKTLEDCKRMAIAFADSVD